MILAIHRNSLICLIFIEIYEIRDWPLYFKLDLIIFMTFIIFYRFVRFCLISWKHWNMIPSIHWNSKISFVIIFDFGRFWECRFWWNPWILFKVVSWSRFQWKVCPAVCVDPLQKSWAPDGEILLKFQILIKSETKWDLFLSRWILNPTQAGWIPDTSGCSP